VPVGLVQVGASLCVLIPFVLVQAGRLGTRSVGYLLANAGGSGVLAFDAALGEDWGFLLLEGVWAAVSVAGLWRVLRPKPVPPGAP
jgi:hypothetical protein